MSRIAKLAGVAAWCMAMVTTPATATEPSTCNGSAALCRVPLTDAVFATTHNSFAATDDGFVSVVASQRHSVARQLDAGIRGLMLDFHENGGDTVLCHGRCSVIGFGLGELDAVDVLADLRRFVQSHDDQVVAVIVESHVPHRRITRAFDDAGLSDLVYAHPSGQPWPTLGEVLSSRTPIVVFTDDNSADLPRWQHRRADWMTGTDWRYRWFTGPLRDRIEALTSPNACELIRDDTSSPFIEMNHFIAFTGGNRDASRAANQRDLLVDRARQCATMWGRLPNFIAVDYSDLGDVVGAVEVLNRDAASSH